jgi:hypothetical protein
MAWLRLVIETADESAMTAQLVEIGRRALTV